MPSPAPIVPVILAGGSGTRLWPVSRDSLPKQFQVLTGSHTLYQQTLQRVADPSLFAAPLVLTHEDFRFFARRQAAEIGMEVTVALEPMRRDSGPALIAAALIAQKLHGEDCLVLALAADHVVLDEPLFLDACRAGAQAAAEGQIVTFGITPTEPSTAYGYIRPGSPAGAGGARPVAAFVEKPDLATATRYVAEGYLWNSGNFFFPASVLLEEATRFEPDMVAAVRAAVETAIEDLGFIKLDAGAFATAPAKSIDYAVMEHTRRAAVVEGRFRWSDVGSWDALHDLAEGDEAGNVTRGPVTLLDSRNSYFHSEGPLVAGIGLDNLSVIATEDAVLVMPIDRAQDVKGLVAQLKTERHNAASEHLKAHRPWGSYQTVCRGERFHVKKIVVEPGGRLSLQKHYHRAEHWIVVKGTAEVTLDGRVFEVRENESTYLPLGGVHRLANPGKIPLELIEVQTGSYLGEDDIVRIEDVYNRP
ncbi:mannose-1-phosphate guanylyltransferase/mannose-6-phosphate isomerase [Ancylobacter defluvii]|uniref:mannose-1-phosphate guanylyltransferase n=1 Tax=Ancylobacter defluvii TaxID=1282440 RepID=A0A9W6JUP2_9HYPH|nr:mannose-1-phosphate guanylyltransferase/mannose-6-phosphate isomerase [Ancylobacter defluvii]MBS7587920.1 mannose-1-phosphate guanylyltransferase/mannose-6-phosphate isomerase [Ancylobacter defluvii]GLK83602.1 mannose-1-phosphate guanylyltransferase/mannose-6-phosphate isomerase [Ancylobacter defluvii]